MILSPSTKGQKTLDRVKSFLSDNVDPIESQFSVSNCFQNLFFFINLCLHFRNILKMMKLSIKQLKL